MNELSAIKLEDNFTVENFRAYTDKIQDLFERLSAANNPIPECRKTIINYHGLVSCFESYVFAIMAFPGDPQTYSKLLEGLIPNVQLVAQKNSVPV